MLYSEQFKFNAVIRYLSGPHRSYTSVARDIGVHRQTLRSWVEHAKARHTVGRLGDWQSSIGDPSSPDAVLEEENRRLLAKVLMLEQLLAKMLMLEADRNALHRTVKLFAREP